MKTLKLAIIAAALTAVGSLAANALPLPGGALAPAAGVAGPFDDNMFIFKPPGPGVVEGLAATASQISSCSGPGSPLRGGCLFLVPNPLGLGFNTAQEDHLTAVFDSLGTTLTDIFGFTCDGVGCNLFFLSQIGITPIDLSGVDTSGWYSVNAVAGAPATVFDATYYLSPAYRDANPGVFARFVSATSIPEPATLTLFGAGMLGAAAIRRRKKRG
jgi:hypothetical protein